MKKSILCIIAVLVSASLCHAGGLRFGAHGAYTVGGDIGERVPLGMAHRLELM